MNIDHTVEKVRRTVESHKLSDGAYARYLWQNEKGTRKMGVNEYGCADAANLLYIIGDFPSEPAIRAKWISTMQQMQDKETGLFHENTHHTFHTTAHVTAALELFDARPLYPLTAFEKYLDTDELFVLLESINWYERPWSEAHIGAGLYAALANTRRIDAAWQDVFFGWLTERCSPETGISYGEKLGGAPLSHHLYGWFHYLFCFEHAHRPIPYPEKLIDSIITLYRTHEDPYLGMGCDFREVDVVYSINRASRQTPHRFDEVKELLRDFAGKYISRLTAIDETKDDAFNDLHRLFGVMCCVAELQSALPGEYTTTVPLRSVLDRRPFI